MAERAGWASSRFRHFMRPIGSGRAQLYHRGHRPADQKTRSGKSRRHHSRHALQSRRFAGGGHQIHRAVHQGWPGRSRAQLGRAGGRGCREQFRRALFRAARRPGQPLQRLRRGNRRRRPAGLRPRARRRRHLHPRQRHGAKPRAAGKFDRAGRDQRHQRPRRIEGHHPEILPHHGRLHAIEGRGIGHRAAGRAELQPGHRREGARQPAAVGFHSRGAIYQV